MSNIKNIFDASKGNEWKKKKKMGGRTRPLCTPYLTSPHLMDSLSLVLIGYSGS